MNVTEKRNGDSFLRRVKIFKEVWFLLIPVLGLAVTDHFAIAANAKAVLDLKVEIKETIKKQEVRQEKIQKLLREQAETNGKIDARTDAIVRQLNLLIIQMQKQ